MQKIKENVGKVLGVWKQKSVASHRPATLCFRLVLRTRVPRAGVEPARVAPLVFETSASTDSAIWAWLRY